MRVFLRF